MIKDAEIRLLVIRDLQSRGLIEDDHRKQFQIEIIDKYVIRGQHR